MHPRRRVSDFGMPEYVQATNLTLMAVEMMASASLPLYLEKTFGNMSLMADFSIAIMLASVIGSQLSALAVNRFPLKRSYLGLVGASFLAALTIGLIANFGRMTVPLLMGLFFLYRALQAASLSAENVVIPSVFGSNQRAMEDLRGHKQSWNAVASAVVQNGAAAVVVMLGTATRNFIIAPWFYVLSMALTWSSLEIPRAADEARREGWLRKMAKTGGTGPLAAAGAALRSYGGQIAHGLVVVTRDPALRISAVASALMMLFKWMIFYLLPALFAMRVIGPKADPSQAAPIIGLIIGLFSFGGLFAGKFVAVQAEALHARLGEDRAAIREAARVSTIEWLKLAAFSFLLFGVLALPLPSIGPLASPAAIAAAVASRLGVAPALVPARLLLAGVLGLGTVLAMWRPKVGLAVALIPVLLAFPVHVILAALSFFAFGVLQVIATLKNDSLFDALVQERAPSAAGDTRAFVSASSLFAAMLGLIAMKFLFYGKLPFGIPSPAPGFSGLPGAWPFVVAFAGLAAPAAAVFSRAARRLDALTRPGTTVPGAPGPIAPRGGLRLAQAPAVSGLLLSSSDEAVRQEAK